MLGMLHPSLTVGEMEGGGGREGKEREKKEREKKVRGTFKINSRKKMTTALQALVQVLRSVAVLPIQN